VRELKRRGLWLALGWLLVTLVIVLSLIPPLPDPLPILGFSDKLGHLFTYTLLMGWFVQLYVSRRLLLIHALLFIAMGAGLEVLQGMGGVRHFEYLDMVANTAGVLLGLFSTRLAVADLLQRLET